MRNLIIFDEYQSSQVNGVGTFVRNLIAMMPRDRFNVSLVNMNSPAPELRIINTHELTVYDFPIINHGDFRRAAERIVTLLNVYLNDSDQNIFAINHSPAYLIMKTLKKVFPKSSRVFIIHNQGWNTPLMGNYNSLKTIIVEKRKPRNISGETFSFIMKYAENEKKTYRLSDAVIALSASTVKILRDIYQIRMENIHYIPNSTFLPNEEDLPPTDIAKKNIGISPQDKVLLFVGRIEPSKGIYILLDSFKALVRTNPGLRLVIVGFGSDGLRYISTMDLFLRSRITFMSQIPNQNMHEVYNAADICIIPSFSEQCSYVALEMMARKKLIVTSDAIGQCDLFQNGKNAIVFSYDCDHKLSAITSAIEKAIDLKDELRHKYGEYNRALITGLYSVDIQKEKYMKLFNSL